MKRCLPTVVASIALAWILAGCVAVPAPLQGDFPEFYPDQAIERSTGAVVRWGGRVVETRAGAADTCLEILAIRLDEQHRPVHSDASRGRFLACRSGFVDPEVFSPGREVTVIGRLTEIVERPVDEYRYRYPKVEADTLYLWPVTWW